MFQHYNEENGQHRHDADAGGDDEQHRHIGVEKRNPLEDFRIDLPDGLRLEVRVDVVVDVVAHLIQFVIIPYQHLHAAHLVLVPVVEALHLPDVHQCEHVVVLREPRVVDACHGETACARRVLHEVGLHLVAKMQQKFVGHLLGNHNLAARGGVAQLQQVALHKVMAEKVGVERLVHTLQHHAFHLVGGLDDAHLGGKILQTRHLRLPTYFLHKRLVLVERHLLVGVVLVEMGDADVRTHRDDLVANGLPVARRDADGHHHDDHTDGDTHHRQAYDGTGETVSLVLQDPIGQQK